MIYGKVKGNEIQTLATRLEEVLTEVVKAQLEAHYPLIRLNTANNTYNQINNSELFRAL